jgi:hypothetical protein
MAACADTAANFGCFADFVDFASQVAVGKAVMERPMMIFNLVQRRKTLTADFVKLYASLFEFSRLREVSQILREAVVRLRAHSDAQNPAVIAIS